ncbi:patatin-like phospholipase family protein [Sulfurimonas sp. SAG-AH-194-C20]|nr:patatin-like phospholipase family protein [Sulfurimonas sp. SAG-AH-194-C20]MDF1879470.1 patatin-like phospholipase family protein [Sulfurimonas sp. SAG-AH-194-C20]
MKLFLLILVLLSSLSHANERPKIALVLSGGGARGGAHVGILKELEKNRIPIDMIVGTSMGSFVGGLYASGMTPQEIEMMLTTTDWQEYIRTNYNRQDMPMRRKSVDYMYQGRLGLGINADSELVLPTGVLKRQPMLLKFDELTQNVRNITDFDKLSIPFRAVATDIKNGDGVILKSGSLAESIYASSSIPGGFQPINIKGIDLVDGGVSDNFPIQVARDMGADIIIAVDVSENFSDKLDVNSYFVVMGQLINILMRKNANESISTLDEADILLTPDLDGFSGLNTDKYTEIISRGVDAAKKEKQKLQVLSISEKEYAAFTRKHRKKILFDAPIVDEIKIDNPTYISDDSIRRRLSQQVGTPLDLTQLRADLLHLYNMTIFDSVTYELKDENEKKILIIHTTPSWDNHGEIRFAIGIEDDFDGHSAYSLKLGYTMFGLNSLGGEWKNNFEIGRYKRASTEWFQPLDTKQRYYIRPSLSYESVTDVFPIESFANQELYSSRVGGSFAFGAHITTDYEFELGVSMFKDEVQVDAFNFNEKYNAKPIYARINIDNLDNVNFPQVGIKTTLVWTKEMSEWGSDYSYEQIYFDIEKPFRFYANNITFYAKLANTYKPDDIARLAGTYSLGGLFNLSGYAPYSFNGDNMALVVLRYTYELKDGGFFGTLNAPLYAGFSAEIGNTWNGSSDLNYELMKESATMYVAADTLLGPLYLAFGYALNGNTSAYLYLGEKF